MARAWKDISAYLATVVPLGLTEGVNLFVGRVTDEAPDASVFCLPGVSLPPQPVLNGAPQDLRFYGVQVLVRGSREGLEAAADLADLVRDALNHAKPLVGAGPDQYTTVELDQASPLRLKEDKNDRPRFSVNVTAWIKETNPVL